MWSWVGLDGWRLYKLLRKFGMKEGAWFEKGTFELSVRVVRKYLMSEVLRWYSANKMQR